jgi:hypothetical protein
VKLLARSQEAWYLSSSLAVLEDMYESDPMQHGICMRPVQSWPAVKMFAMGAAFLLNGI